MEWNEMRATCGHQWLCIRRPDNLCAQCLIMVNPRPVHVVLGDK